MLQPGFKDELGRFVKILKPFVHWYEPTQLFCAPSYDRICSLNDLMTIQDHGSDDSDEDEDAEVEDGSTSAVEALSE